MDWIPGEPMRMISEEEYQQSKNVVIPPSASQVRCSGFDSGGPEGRSGVGGGGGDVCSELAMASLYASLDSLHTSSRTSVSSLCHTTTTNNNNTNNNNNNSNNNNSSNSDNASRKSSPTYHMPEVQRFTFPPLPASTPRCSARRGVTTLDSEAAKTTANGSEFLLSSSSSSSSSLKGLQQTLREPRDDTEVTLTFLPEQETLEVTVLVPACFRDSVVVEANLQRSAAPPQRHRVRWHCTFVFRGLGSSARDLQAFSLRIRFLTIVSFKKRRQGGNGGVGSVGVGGGGGGSGGGFGGGGIVGGVGIGGGGGGGVSKAVVSYSSPQSPRPCVVDDIISKADVALLSTRSRRRNYSCSGAGVYEADAALSERKRFYSRMTSAPSNMHVARAEEDAKLEVSENRSICRSQSSNNSDDLTSVDFFTRISTQSFASESFFTATSPTPSCRALTTSPQSPLPSCEEWSFAGESVLTRGNSLGGGGAAELDPLTLSGLDVTTQNDVTDLLGEAVLPLKDSPLTSGVCAPLQDTCRLSLKNPHSVNWKSMTRGQGGRVGDLFVILQHQPLSRRIKVFISHAASLPPAFFRPEHLVVVQQLYKDQAVSERRTVTLPGESPAWKETALFPAGQDRPLSAYSFRLLLVRRRQFTSDLLLGRVTLGRHVGETGAAHWFQMARAPGHECGRWHSIVALPRGDEFSP